MVAAVRIGLNALPGIARLRSSVWASQAPLPKAVSDVWTDEHDEHARHWGCFDGEELVACARLCVHAHIEDIPHSALFSGNAALGPVASINRLVVTPSWQGRGLAKALDRVRLTEIDELGIGHTVAFVWKRTGATRLLALEAQGFRRLSNDWQDEPPFGSALPLVRRRGER